MRRFLAGALAAAVLVASSFPAKYAAVAIAAASDLKMFPAETAAQTHCPRDVVAWLNIPTHVYHEKGMRWYGRTKHGAYVCKKEADAAGDRDTRNGQ